jgi:PKD repeat protein
MKENLPSSLKHTGKIFLIACIIGVLPFSLFSQEWNICGGNPSRNGLSPIPGPQTPAIVWQGTEPGLFGFPIFIENNILVTSRFVSLTNSPVVCHDLNTGQLLWTADVTNGTGRSIPIGARDGRVYVMRFLEGVNGDSLKALDALTGATLWVADELIRPATMIGCTFASNGDLIVEGNLSLLRIDATDGSTVWETSIYPWVLGYLCPVVFGNTVYVQQNALESITAIDINTGAIKYTTAIEPYGGNVQTILMVGTDGILYAQTTDAGGQVSAIEDNGDSLQVLWSTPTVGYSVFSYMAESPDSTIYAPSNGKIMRLLKSTGEIIDSTDALGSPSLFIAMVSVGSDGKVYISTGSTFQCTNPDLTPIFTETIPDLNTSACALGPNNLLAISGSGTDLRVYGSTNSFSASETALCEKFCVDFIDLSTNNPTFWQWSFPGGNPATSTDQNPSQICYDTPGLYGVTLITTTANGTDTVTLVNYITVYSTPPIPTITQTDNTLTTSPAMNYQWQFNNVDIPGATNQSYTVTETGFYTVVISDSNGCVNAATLYIATTGMADVLHDSNISIYPNPSAGKFIVECISSETSGEISIRVVNTMGEEVCSIADKITSDNWAREIDLSNAGNGIYFLEIKNDDKWCLRNKIVVAD